MTTKISALRKRQTEKKNSYPKRCGKWISAMKITEEQRKLLTEWLGEYYQDGIDREREYECGRKTTNRTFNNWRDFFVLTIKLKEKGEVFLATNIYTFANTAEQACILVSEAIKEGTIK